MSTYAGRTHSIKGTTISRAPTLATSRRKPRSARAVASTDGLRRKAFQNHSSYSSPPSSPSEPASATRIKVQSPEVQLHSEEKTAVSQGARDAADSGLRVGQNAPREQQAPDFLRMLEQAQSVADAILEDEDGAVAEEVASSRKQYERAGKARTTTPATIAPPALPGELVKSVGSPLQLAHPPPGLRDKSISRSRLQVRTGADTSRRPQNPSLRTRDRTSQHSASSVYQGGSGAPSSPQHSGGKTRQKPDDSPASRLRSSPRQRSQASLGSRAAPIDSRKSKKPQRARPGPGRVKTQLRQAGSAAVTAWVGDVLHDAGVAMRVRRLRINSGEMASLLSADSPAAVAALRKVLGPAADSARARQMLRASFARQFAATSTDQQSGKPHSTRGLVPHRGSALSAQARDSTRAAATRAAQAAIVGRSPRSHSLEELASAASSEFDAGKPSSLKAASSHIPSGTYRSWPRGGGLAGTSADAPVQSIAGQSRGPAIGSPLQLGAPRARSAGTSSVLAADPLDRWDASFTSPLKHEREQRRADLDAVLGGSARSAHALATLLGAKAQKAGNVGSAAKRVQVQHDGALSSSRLGGIASVDALASEATVLRRLQGVAPLLEMVLMRPGRFIGNFDGSEEATLGQLPPQPIRSALRQLARVLQAALLGGGDADSQAQALAVAQRGCEFMVACVNIDVADSVSTIRGTESSSTGGGELSHPVSVQRSAFEDDSKACVRLQLRADAAQQYARVIECMSGEIVSGSPSSRTLTSQEDSTHLQHILESSSGYLHGVAWLLARLCKGHGRAAVGALQTATALLKSPGLEQLGQTRSLICATVAAISTVGDWIRTSVAQSGLGPAVSDHTRQRTREAEERKEEVAQLVHTQEAKQQWQQATSEAAWHAPGSHLDGTGLARASALATVAPYDSSISSPLQVEAPSRKNAHVRGETAGQLAGSTLVAVATHHTSESMNTDAATPAQEDRAKAPVGLSSLRDVLSEKIGQSTILLAEDSVAARQAVETAAHESTAADTGALRVNVLDANHRHDSDGVSATPGPDGEKGTQQREKLDTEEASLLGSRSNGSGERTPAGFQDESEREAGRQEKQVEVGKKTAASLRSVHAQWSVVRFPGPQRLPVSSSAQSQQTAAVSKSVRSKHGISGLGSNGHGVEAGKPDAPGQPSPGYFATDITIGASRRTGLEQETGDQLVEARSYCTGEAGLSVDEVTGVRRAEQFEGRGDSVATIPHEQGEVLRTVYGTRARLRRLTAVELASLSGVYGRLLGLGMVARARRLGHLGRMSAMARALGHVNLSMKWATYCHRNGRAARLFAVGMIIRMHRRRRLFAASSRAMALGAFVVEHRWRVDARERRKHILLKKVRTMGAKAAKTLMQRRSRKAKGGKGTSANADDELLMSLALTKNVNWDVLDEVRGSLWDQHRRILRPKSSGDDSESDPGSEDNNTEQSGEIERAKRSGMTWMDAFGLDTDGVPYDVAPDSILRGLLRQSAAHFQSTGKGVPESADTTPRVRLAAAASPPDGGHSLHARRVSQFTRSDNATALLELQQLPTGRTAGYSRGARTDKGRSGGPGLRSPGQAAAIVAQTADEITQLVSHPAQLRLSARLFPDLVDQFGVAFKETAGRKSSSSAGGGGGSTPRPGRKSEAVKRLFDDGDAKQMDIALMRILQQHEKQVAEDRGETGNAKSRRKGGAASRFSSPGAIVTPYDWIAQCIQSADLGGLGGMEVLEALLRMPCWDRRLADVVKAHVARQRSLAADSTLYDVGSDRSFGPAELFVLAVPLGVAQALQKLKCLQFVGSVTESLQHLHVPVSRLHRACSEVLQSPRLVVLLRDVMLPAGNALNTHSTKAAASGIKLSSLPALARTRSKSNTSLLRFIADRLVRLGDSQAADEATMDSMEGPSTHNGQGRKGNLPSLHLLHPERLKAQQDAHRGSLNLPAIEESSEDDPAAASPPPQAPPKTPKPGTPLEDTTLAPASGSGSSVGLQVSHHAPLIRRTSSMIARKQFASIGVRELLEPAAELPTAMTVGRVSLDQVVSDSLQLYQQCKQHLDFVERLVDLEHKRRQQNLEHEEEDEEAAAAAATNGTVEDEMPGARLASRHRRRVTVDRREPSVANTFSEVVLPLVLRAEARISQLLTVCLEAILAYVELCRYTCEQPALPQQSGELRELALQVAIKVATRHGTVVHPSHPAIAASLPEAEGDEDDCVTCSELLDAVQWFVSEWTKEVAYCKQRLDQEKRQAVMSQSRQGRGRRTPGKGSRKAELRASLEKALATRRLSGRAKPRKLHREDSADSMRYCSDGSD